jgi:radical SAM superfamily enzyme YgiQ (UPF0313 family)
MTNDSIEVNFNNGIIMKITFAFPKLEYEPNTCHLNFVNKNLGCHPPLSLTYPAATLREAGHHVNIVDGNALDLNTEDFIQKVNRTNPHIVGFNLSTFTFHESLKIIRELRSKLEVPVFVGGRHVQYYPIETIQREEVDYALLGEADYSVVNFINALESKSDLRKVNGLIFKENGKVVKTNPQDESFDLSGLPTPTYDLLPIEKYYDFLTKRRNYVPVITSRGCPYKCIYCGAGNSLVRFASPNKIIEDMHSLVKLKVREVRFYDNTFTLDKKRTLELCNLMQKEDFDIEFSISTRVDFLNKEIIDALAKAKCIRINFGIESANTKILKSLKKGIDLGMVKNIIQYIQKKGISAFGYFIMGSPGETMQTMKQNLDFAMSSQFDYIQFTRMVAHPHTELNEMMIKQYGRDLWKEYVDTGRNVEIPLIGTNLTIKQTNNFIRKCYKEFFLRPSQVAKILRKVKSITELKHYVKAGFESLH